MNTLHETIRNQVAIYGLGEPIPELNSNLSATTFLKHYYEKQTLTAFCKKHGLSRAGLKNELTKRIAIFLETGIFLKPEKKTLSKAPLDSEQGLRLEKQIINYKSCAVTRTFLSKHVPGFKGFSAKIQKEAREHLIRGAILTYADLVNEYQALLSQKTSRKVTHATCERNQFLMDYHDDSYWDKPHSAKEAWQLVRNSAGNKTYARYKASIHALLFSIETPASVALMERSAIKVSTLHSKRSLGETK